jgi:hypothetical protein
MATLTKPLEELIRELPPEMKNEVRDFVEFLLIKQSNAATKVVQPLRQEWAEKISVSEYSSVELQHLANTWRGE